MQNTVNAPASVGVIEKYVEAHAIAKAAAVRVEQLKPLFIGACDALAVGACDQISVSGALIYKVTRTRWDYSTSNTIAKLEKALEIAKAQFETLHDPASVQYSWAVKGGAK